MMTENSLIFLKKYIDNPSPTGFEYLGQKLWIEEMKKYTDLIDTDTYGTAVAKLGDVSSKYKVMVEAHADEISWLVSFITKDGYLHVKKNGGADEQIAPSKRVRILTEDGVVKGIFGWPATHIRPKDKKPEATSIYVDCGASSKKEVEGMGIQIGDPIVYDEGLQFLGKNKIVGRGLDNRIGGYCLVEIAKYIKENNINLPFQLLLVNSVQEEVGQRGALMIAETLKPNLALVIDVCHDTNTPMITKSSYGDIAIGDGPVITVAPSIHPKVNKMLVASSVSNKIKIQRKASTNKSGTDADAIAYTSGGVPTGLISLPLRYMHTSVETVHADDVTDTIKLIIGVLKEVDCKPIKNI